MVNQLSHFVACVLSHFTCIQPFATLWTVAHQAPLSVGFSRREYQSGLPCPPPGDLPNPGIKHVDSQLSCVSRWVFYHQPHLGNPGRVITTLLLKLPSFTAQSVPVLYGINAAEGYCMSGMPKDAAMFAVPLPPCFQGNRATILNSLDKKKKMHIQEPTSHSEKQHPLPRKCVCLPPQK